jgi:hypothetical protein
MSQSTSSCAAALSCTRTAGLTSTILLITTFLSVVLHDVKISSNMTLSTPVENTISFFSSLCALFALLGAIKLSCFLLPIATKLFIFAVLWLFYLSYTIPLTLFNKSIGGINDFMVGCALTLPGLKLRYTGTQEVNATCLFNSFSSAFGYDFTIFSLGILPNCSRFGHSLRNDMRVIFGDHCLPFHYVLPRDGKKGHISLRAFPSSKFGIRVAALALFNFFDDEGTAKPNSSYLSPAIPALGGLRLTLSQLPATATSPKISEAWSPATFPRQMTHQKVSWNRALNAHVWATERISDFLRSFPVTSVNARLPKLFSEKLVSTLLFAPVDDRHHFVQADYTRRWEQRPYPRAFAPAFAGLARLLDGDNSSESLKSADSVIAVNRFLDTRGNRQVERWEADQWPRWLGLADFANWSHRRQSYREASYRLWSRYLLARTKESLARTTPGVTLAVPAPGTNIALTFVNAVPITGPNAISPEAPLWTDAAQSGLRQGTKQFVDAQGLSRGELIELLSALAPLTDSLAVARVRETVYVVPPPAAPLPGVPAAPAIPARPPTPVAIHNDFIPPHARYLFDNRTDEIFIHYGNSPIPDVATQAVIRANIHRAPDANKIASIMRVLSTRHGAASDLDSGLEAVMYRGVGYVSDNLLNKRNNYTANEVIHSDGNWEYFSCTNQTACAYFDTLRLPAPISQNCQYTLAMDSDELIQNSVLMCHARAVSLSWAAFAISMQGRSWQNRPGNEPNQFVGNHVDVWLRTYGMENLNLWSTVHANAMGFMYGFAPSALTRTTEALSVRHFWDRFQTPYLVNHYLELWMVELIPSFMILPYADNENTSHPTWEEGSPLPVSDFVSFQGDVQIGRDLKPLAGRSWLGDGGYHRNLQFYAAQGVNDVFRYEGQTPDFQNAFWQHQMVHQFPQNPANVNPVWMAPRGSPFADFILPGSITTIDLTVNRTLAWGVRLQPTTPRSDPIWQRWYALSQQQANNSLMVNYVHPLRQKREIETLEDYSVLIWEESNRFAGMSLVRYDLPDGDAGLRFSPDKIPMPHDLGLPSARGSSTSHQASMRVTAHRPFGSDDTANRIQARFAPKVQEVPFPPATIAYNGKYPTNQSQLPHFDPATVTMNGEGIALSNASNGEEWVEPHLRADPTASRDAQSALDAWTQHQLETDMLYEEFLAKQRSEAAEHRANYEAQQVRISSNANQRRAHEQQLRANRKAQRPVSAPVAPRGSNTRAGPTATTWAKAAVVNPPRGAPVPVVPNDNAAPIAQTTLLEQQRSLQQEIDANNRLKPQSSGFKHQTPTPPQQRSPLFQPAVNPFEELASRVKFEKSGSSQDVHTDPDDGATLANHLEAEVEVKQPENLSGTQ